MKTMPLSTKHLRPETIKLLWNTALIDLPFEGGFYTVDGFIIKVTPPNEQDVMHDCPDEILTIMTVARVLSFDFVILHPDFKEERQILRTFRATEPT